MWIWSVNRSMMTSLGGCQAGNRMAHHRWGTGVLRWWWGQLVWNSVWGTAGVIWQGESWCGLGGGTAGVDNCGGGQLVWTSVGDSWGTSDGPLTLGDRCCRPGACPRAAPRHSGNRPWGTPPQQTPP